MDCKRFFGNVKNKRIAICGIGISNTPLALRFLEQGAHVFVCDKRDREAIGELADRLEKAGAELRLGENYLSNLEVDVIFRTPGMNFNMPELKKARRNGIAVTSEMEVFFDLCPATIFAVTGSDGKTTTTTLIAKMLEADGKKVHLGGNIGRPLLPQIDDIKPDDFVVAELSSFQLISMRKSPDVAVVTNIAPNHLDVHKDMQEYIDSKRNIVLHQNAFSRTVLNYDNEITHGFSKDVRGQVLGFSMKEPVKCGAYLNNSDGFLYMTYRDINVPIMRKDEIAVIGEHNVANFLAAISAVWGYVKVDSIKKVAHEFTGVEHRIEFVRELNGVKYYNDSIASSPTRTIAGLKSFKENIILIAGGYDKHIPFEPMVPYIIEKVKCLILSGPTAEKIETALKSSPDFKGSPKIIHVKNMEEAVAAAHKEAVSGDTVTLSPACASFDAYPNFAIRGDHYKKLVQAL